MSPVITVDSLGKKYILNHQAKQESYTALRDVLSNGVRNLGRRLLGRGNAKGQDTAQEEFWALKDVSFEVKQGDRIGIIGRNGAGKSTLLKILSRITEPTTGIVKIRGRVASLLEVGTGFHPELTGRENVYLNGAILGMGRVEIKRKFDEIVAFAEVEKFLDTPVKRYSSGMYVRLAFAVAAHLEPEILIVDEVLAVGDAQFQKKCLGKMEDVGKEGRTVLFVSHNLTAIRTLCSRAILLKQGMLVADESAIDSIDEYVGELQENVLTRDWIDRSSAPRNSSVCLHRVTICVEEGTSFDSVCTDIPLLITIEYSIETAGSFVGLTLIIHDSENNCVFSSINNLEEEWYGKPMPVGIYKTTCRIPADFFNNGLYSVSLNIFGMCFSDAYLVRDVLRFEVMDGANLRGDYFGEFAGVVRPRLFWETKLACYEDIVP